MFNFWWYYLTVITASSGLEALDYLGLRDDPPREDNVGHFLPINLYQLYATYVEFAIRCHFDLENDFFTNIGKFRISGYYKKYNLSEWQNLFSHHQAKNSCHYCGITYILTKNWFGDNSEELLVIEHKIWLYSDNFWYYIENASLSNAIFSCSR